MLALSALDNIKAFAELEAAIIPGGGIYLINEGNTYTWRKASKAFDLNVFRVGDKINSNSIVFRAMEENKTLIQSIPAYIYGTKMIAIAEPVVNEDGQVVGAFSIIFPKLHPVLKSFNNFAPIMAEAFPEGAFILATDLEKVTHRQPSKKFDVPGLYIGCELDEEEIASKVIKSKQSVSIELDSSAYGVPTYVTAYPLFDEDDSYEVVATLGVAVPKITASSLRDMSENLESSLSRIASAIGGIAVSASHIHSNQQELNKEIKEIIELTEGIDEVSTFIKKIAEAIKMLGLNASIEAARAGEAGKGFGVVAKEIKKLSEQSKSTVLKIKELTNKIKEKVDETSMKSCISLSSSQEQADITEEITTSIQGITSMSVELNKIAHEL
ncbi:methyl-accepting chemotaxis protein [Clostridium sp. PL3]|uniref:Methyl-accepting chemotaxis protein n=1 Tax=Clostridium thailandense TaxID=2794346 RepID=A0A949WS30_9CLOT|nr:methyl-accepting chemotaxis protein [Clostridium thailandense]MBV7274715.1 methyl-accepting chemotaxis protein [Clostridium thailandense]